MRRVSALILLVMWLALTAGATEPGPALRPDHVVVAVRDLASARQTYQRLGFSVRPGRRHPNSVSNAFVKLMDGTELELLTAEQPLDRQAAEYLAFVQQGEGGAYLALAAGPVAEVARIAFRYGLRSKVQLGHAFDILTFPDEPDLQHVFFIQYHDRASGPPAHRVHRNGAAALAEVWLDGGQTLARLLLALGGRSVDPPAGPDGLTGPAIRVGEATLVLVPPAGHPVRPRIRGVTLRTRPRVEAGGLIPSEEAHGVWIRFATATAPSPADGLPDRPAGD
ncbi:MAG: VOC family protein [Acidobacteria bacterium]|nr:VOC family protein [Acidobacteriota bacterium]